MLDIVTSRGFLSHSFHDYITIRCSTVGFASRLLLGIYTSISLNMLLTTTTEPTQQTTRSLAQAIILLHRRQQLPLQALAGLDCRRQLAQAHQRIHLRLLVEQA